MSVRLVIRLFQSGRECEKVCARPFVGDDVR